MTDHRALIPLQTQDTLSPRQIRWVASLQQYSIKIDYIPGPGNYLADILSRLPLYQPLCARCSKRVEPEEGQHGRVDGEDEHISVLQDEGAPIVEDITCPDCAPELSVCRGDYADIRGVDTRKGPGLKGQIPDEVLLLRGRMSSDEAVNSIDSADYSDTKPAILVDVVSVAADAAATSDVTETELPAELTEEIKAGYMDREVWSWEQKKK